MGQLPDVAGSGGVVRSSRAHSHHPPSASCRRRAGPARGLLNQSGNESFLGLLGFDLPTGAGNVAFRDATISATPEPATIALVGGGLVVVLAAARRRRNLA